MAVKPIRLFGDPVLRKPAIEVVDFDREVRRLVEDLTDTMLAAPGAGLAAPQIGVGLRAFVWHVDGEVGHLVNPVLELSEEQQHGLEGCLSIPDLSIECTRALSVVARGFDMYGEHGFNSILGSINTKTFLPGCDLVTARYASELVGQTTVWGRGFDDSPVTTNDRARARARRAARW